VEGSGNEHSGFIYCWEVLEWRLLKKDPVPWSQLLSNPKASRLISLIVSNLSLEGYMRSTGTWESFQRLLGTAVLQQLRNKEQG
jgi:hypothetical protein